MGSILGLIILVVNIIAIVDAVKSSMEKGKKILWVLLIIFIPIIGVVLYYVIGKKK